MGRRWLHLHRERRQYVLRDLRQPVFSVAASFVYPELDVFVMLALSCL